VRTKEPIGSPSRWARSSSGVDVIVDLQFDAEGVESVEHEPDARVPLPRLELVDPSTRHADALRELLLGPAFGFASFAKECAEIGGFAYEHVATFL
jgi:hypothetical protein